MIRIDTTGFGKRSQQHPRLSYVLPDHGKLMHAFLVRMPGLDAFAHLHPNRRDTLHYESVLPQLPAGKYLLYADVVYRSGYAETMTDTVAVPAPVGSDAPDTPVESASAQTTDYRVTGIAPDRTTAHQPERDPDDSWLVVEPVGVKAKAVNVPYLDNDIVVCGKPGANVRLADGSTMLWMDKPTAVFEAGKLYSLKFAVADAQGRAAPLEPYLGMGGHAVVLRSDGSVYIHLHPIGTYSMAAENSLAGRIADTSRTFHYPNASRFRDSIDRYVAQLRALPEAEANQRLMAGMPGMNHTMPGNNMVAFPYAFPRAGHYRIWIQVKRNGRVLTGVFDTKVVEPLL